jgi:hypothetical protein
MTERLITIAKFRDPAVAQLARSKLESEGIWSVVADDQVVGISYFIAMGQVAEADAGKAIEILDHEGLRGDAQER